MDNYIEHHGILGQKWGVRRFQNPDGSLTEAGKKRYLSENHLENAPHTLTKKGQKELRGDIYTRAYNHYHAKYQQETLSYMNAGRDVLKKYMFSHNKAYNKWESLLHEYENMKYGQERDAKDKQLKAAWDELFTLQNKIVSELIGTIGPMPYELFTINDRSSNYELMEQGRWNVERYLIEAQNFYESAEKYSN